MSKQPNHRLAQILMLIAAVMLFACGEAQIELSQRGQALAGKIIGPKGSAAKKVVYSLQTVAAAQTDGAAGHACNATMIAENVALTAAHCLTAYESELDRAANMPPPTNAEYVFRLGGTAAVKNLVASACTKTRAGYRNHVFCDFNARGTYGPYQLVGEKKTDVRRILGWAYRYTDMAFAKTFPGGEDFADTSVDLALLFLEADRSSTTKIATATLGLLAEDLSALNCEAGDPCLRPSKGKYANLAWPTVAAVKAAGNEGTAGVVYSFAEPRRSYYWVERQTASDPTYKGTYLYKVGFIQNYGERFAARHTTRGHLFGERDNPWRSDGAALRSGAMRPIAFVRNDAYEIAAPSSLALVDDPRIKTLIESGAIELPTGQPARYNVSDRIALQNTDAWALGGDYWQDPGQQPERTRTYAAIHSGDSGGPMFEGKLDGTVSLAQSAPVLKAVAVMTMDAAVEAEQILRSRYGRLLAYRMQIKNNFGDEDRHGIAEDWHRIFLQRFSPSQMRWIEKTLRSAADQNLLQAESAGGKGEGNAGQALEEASSLGCQLAPSETTAQLAMLALLALLWVLRRRPS